MSNAVCRYSHEIFNECYSPTCEYDRQKRSVRELQMPIPGKSHENIRSNQKQYRKDTWRQQCRHGMIFKARMIMGRPAQCRSNLLAKTNSNFAYILYRGLSPLLNAHPALIFPDYGPPTNRPTISFELAIMPNRTCN